MLWYPNMHTLLEITLYFSKHLNLLGAHTFFFLNSWLYTGPVCLFPHPLPCKPFCCNSWCFTMYLLSVGTDFRGDRHLSLTELSWIIACCTVKQNMFQPFLKRSSHPAGTVTLECEGKEKGIRSVWMELSCCQCERDWGNTASL